MPRITVAGGPTNAGAAEGEVGYVEIRGEHGPELVDLPEGSYMVGDEGFEGAPDLTVLRPYASMKLAELREVAKEQGKPTSGSKADLVARLDSDGVGRVVPEEASA